MGLYDGRIGTNGYASTAHVATLTKTPVVLVVDISRASRSVGAVVHGMATYDPSVEIAGVILNKAGSPRHAAEVADSIDLPILGTLGRDDAISAPSRHLGLVPAAERAEASHALDALADLIAEAVDLEAVLKLASTAPDLDASPWDPAREVVSTSSTSGGSDRGPLVAMAGGRAFTFRYTETEELLRAAGCRVADLRPARRQRAPRGHVGHLPRWWLPGGARTRTQRERPAPRRAVRRHRGRHPNRGRVRRPALPVPVGRRRRDGRVTAGHRGDDPSADALLPDRDGGGRLAADPGGRDGHRSRVPPDPRRARGRSDSGMEHRRRAGGFREPDAASRRTSTCTGPATPSSPSASRTPSTPSRWLRRAARPVSKPLDPVVSRRSFLAPQPPNKSWPTPSATTATPRSGVPGCSTSP